METIPSMSSMNMIFLFSLVTSVLLTKIIVIIECAAIFSGSYFATFIVVIFSGFCLISLRISSFST